MQGIRKDLSHLVAFKQLPGGVHHGQRRVQQLPQQQQQLGQERGVPPHGDPRGRLAVSGGGGGGGGRGIWVLMEKRVLLQHFEVHLRAGLKRLPWTIIRQSQVRIQYTAQRGELRCRSRNSTKGSHGYLCAHDLAAT